MARHSAVPPAHQPTSPAFRESSAELPASRRCLRTSLMSLEKAVAAALTTTCIFRSSAFSWNRQRFQEWTGQTWEKCHKRTHWCNLKLEDTRIPKFYGKIHGERLIQKELKENHTILPGDPYCTLRQPHCISLLCRASLRSHSCNHRPCQRGSHWAHLATAMSDGCLTAKPMDFFETWHGPAACKRNTPQRHHWHGTSSQYEQYFDSRPKQSLIRVHFQHSNALSVQVGQPDIWTLLGARFRRGTVRDAPPRPALDQWDLSNLSPHGKRACEPCECHPWDPHESNGIQWVPVFKIL